MRPANDPDEGGLTSPDILEIRSLGHGDWYAVRRIYEEGIETGDATFETETPGWESWDANHLGRCRLVAERAGRVGGGAALAPVSGRCVSGGGAEGSVYVCGDARGSGIGLRLLTALVESSERAGLWTLQAGIFPENVASLRIHERAGFRQVGRRERLGRLDGRWRDVLLLERRSPLVGTEIG